MVGILCQFFSGGQFSMAGAELKAEPVPFVAGNDMEVEVGDFLTGHLPIRQQQIDALAGDPALEQSLGKPLGEVEQAAAVIGGQI